MSEKSPSKESTTLSAPFSLDNAHYCDPTNIPDELAQFPHRHIQPVIWNDMDAFSHVNNVVYYRYAETARIGYMHCLNIFGKNITTVLAKSECTYILPVEFPDTLLVGVRTKSLGNSSLVMEYCYYSTAQQKVVATGESVLVRLDEHASKKLNWTQDEREQVINFEQSVGHSIP